MSTPRIAAADALLLQGEASAGAARAAAEIAVRAGAWAVTVAGAQPSLPTMEQLAGFGELSP